MDIIETLFNIKAYIKSKGFSYDDGIIESLYLSLKTKPFVVISGKNGSGKTSLARLFAESIGATYENGRYKQISPESDWHTSSRLMGYVTAEGKFVPGIIASYVLDAMANPDLPYFLCIDDMNLARPEGYLSPIVAALESRRFDGESRIVADAIFDKNSFGNDNSAVFSYGGITIPDNLYIIGTVSNDIGSYTLSSGIIDRSFVIDLKSGDLGLKFDFCDEPENCGIEAMIIENSFLKSEFITIKDCNNEDKDFMREISYFLNRINQCMKYLDMPVSYRCRDEIIFYSIYARKYEFFNMDTLSDFILSQRILPRIYGNGRYIKGILCTLFKLCVSRDAKSTEEYAGTSNKMFLTMTNYGCKYPRSCEIITLMMRRFEEDGYTAFWKF